MDDDRRRFARQVLLPEIGASGQERLRAATVTLGGGPASRAIARMYLERAGIGAVVDGIADDAPELDRLAGRPELRTAAEFLSGAFTAVEHVKAVVGAGRAERLATTLTGPPERA